MHSRRLFTIAAQAAILMASAAQANWIGNITIEEPKGSYLPNSVRMWSFFDYKITNADGARFKVKPQYCGHDVPGYTWSGSPIYPVGIGSTDNWFAFWSGTHVVDRYIIQMVTPDWNTVLLSISLPVFFTIGDHAIAHLVPSHTSPSWLMHGETFTIGFTYATTEAGGVKVFARPFYNGSLASGYTASGSDVLPAPGGDATQWFRFNTGDHPVDQVRFQMWNASQTTLLLEFFTPVDLTWGAAGLANFTLSPATPECLGNGQDVTVEFDFATSATNGVYIWAYAADAPGHAASGQTYSGSLLITESTGHLSRSFSFDTAGDQRDIPYVWIRMANAGLTENLVSANLPVDYHWGPNAIQNIATVPAPPAALDDNEHVDVTFDYITAEPGGVRLFLTPLTAGALSPNASMSGSVIYPVGSGSTAKFFTITSGAVTVDQGRFLMTNADQSTTLLDFRRDGPFFFGGPAVVVDTPEGGERPLPLVTLGTAYPNPFNPAAMVPVTLSQSQSVQLDLYDVRGRLLQNVFAGILPAGRTEVQLRPGNLPSGTYLCRLRCGAARQTQRVTLVR